MKTWERKIAPVGFLLAAVLSVFAAFIPTFKGQPLNAAFLPIAILFAIMALVTWRKLQAPVSPPRE